MTKRLPEYQLEANHNLKGPAPEAIKAAWRVMNDEGVPEKKIPEAFKNKVIKRSKKSPIGAIEVKRITGIVDNAAHRIVKQFEKNISGGRDDIGEKLSIIADQLGGEEKKVLDLLNNIADKRSLSHLIAEANASPTRLMDAYMKGCVKLGQIESAILAHQHMPAFVKDLARHALDTTTICEVCVGSGSVKRNTITTHDNRTCPACAGRGTSLVSSKKKEWAMDRLLEITKLKGGDSNTNVNVAVGVNVAGGNGSFMEKISRVNDAILYSRPVAAPIDAEVVNVQSEDN